MKNGIVLPVVVDNGFNGRTARISEIEKKLYKSTRTNKRPHLLSTSHIRQMEKLPY